MHPNLESYVYNPSNFNVIYNPVRFINNLSNKIHKINYYSIL